MPDYHMKSPDGDDMWVFVDSVDGLAVRKGDKPVIYVNKNLNDNERLGVLLHEGCHICFPEATEAQIAKAEVFMRDMVLKCWYNPKSRKRNDRAKRRGRSGGRGEA